MIRTTLDRCVLALLLVACGGGSGSGSPAPSSSSGEPPGEEGGTTGGAPRLAALDPSFGTNGEVTLELELDAVDARAHDVVLGADGKIIVAGSLGDGQTQPTRTFVARLTSEGALDPTFGAGKGFVVMNDDRNSPRLSFENGRPLFVASTKLRRLASDGTIEAEADERLRAFIEIDGGMIIGATSDTLVRLTPELARDTSFGTGGAMPANTSSIFDVLRSGAGFLVASDGDTTLARYDASGVVDTSFGESGRVVVGEGELHRAAVVGSRIVVFGARADQGGTFLKPFAVAFGTSGRVDTSFGTGGALLRTNAGTFGDPVALPDGRIFVLESMPFATSIDRFSESGAFVSSTNVAATNPLSSLPAWSATAMAVEAAGSGKVVVAGNVYDPPNGDAVRRRRVWLARFTN